MIVIKVNEVPNSKEGLKERTRRAWRINQDRLYNQDTLIAVYKGEILEEYKVLGYGTDEIEPKRVAFELEEVPNSQLKGQTIDYRTANPCTIVEPADLGLAESSKMNWDSLYRQIMDLDYREQASLLMYIFGAFETKGEQENYDLVVRAMKNLQSKKED